MPAAILQPDRRFEIPGTADIVAGNGGLPKVRVTTAHATGEIYLHGAHVTSWKPTGCGEVFFVSSQSRWEVGKAIRGGVPISFPWFADRAGDSKAPAHGFVRTKSWQLESIANGEPGVTVGMFTESDDDTKKWWPHDFRADYRVTFGPELSLELAVTNTGKTPMRFEEALHAYYRVENILKARVAGLDGISYIDKTDSNRKKVQNGEIAIVSETDRIYLNTSDAVELEDPFLHCRTRVAEENSRTTVVWNPWVHKAHELPDLPDDEWMQMIAIETSNVSDFAVDLDPGQQQKMTARVSVSPI